MVSELIKAYSGNLVELRDLANKANKGRKGIKVGCHANLLDASRLTKKCWDNLIEAAIMNSWNHAGCLPTDLPGDEILDGFHGFMGADDIDVDEETEHIIVVRYIPIELLKFYFKNIFINFFLNMLFHSAIEC